MLSAAAPEGARSAATASLAGLLVPQENRVDLNGDGVWDSYWIARANATTQACTLTLYNLSDRTRRWVARFPQCTQLYLNQNPDSPAEITTTPYDLAFYPRSFMGDATHDFTVVAKGTLPPGDPGYYLDYWLYAGDGATGAVRDFRLYMGDADSSAVKRLKSTDVVDFHIPGHPGPALFLRMNRGGFHGHLYTFPNGSNSYQEITGDLVPNAFPGVDMPVPPGGKDSEYASIYDTYNPAGCQVITETHRCGVPDNGNGQGIFLDKTAVGDVDADGIDDVLTSYFWKSVVYPGRPDGNADEIGAPKYENYYNPQEDGSTCHSGRHYGESALVNVDDDPYLETLDIAATPVDYFHDLHQNISRNVAVIDTGPASATDPQLVRTVLWNRPFNATIGAIPPGQIPQSTGRCDTPDDMLYQSALHLPGDGMVKDGSGKLRYVYFDRWTQTNHPVYVSPDGVSYTICDRGDLACYAYQLSHQEGYWSFQMLDASTGQDALVLPHAYVWGVIPDPTTGNLWLLYSGAANIWDLGYASFDSADPSYRSDLKFGLLDLQTLTLGQVQRVTFKAKPFMKYAMWQNYDESITSNWRPQHLFTIPVAGSSLPGVVLRAVNGPAVMAYLNGSWTHVTS